MTPKEKTEDLIDLFSRDGYDIIMSEKLAKRCALVTCDEILNALEENRWQNRLMMDYWEEVKQEIKQL